LERRAAGALCRRRFQPDRGKARKKPPLEAFPSRNATVAALSQCLNKSGWSGFGRWTGRPLSTLNGNLRGGGLRPRTSDASGRGRPIREIEMRKSNLRATAAWQALALLGAGVLAAPAMAQDPPPASNETQPPAEEQPAVSPETQAESADEAIVVTGSRLVRPELDAPSPVTTVDSETFDLTGTVTVETLLNELPQLIPGNTRTSNNQGGEDFSPLDLRGIGPSRTLILIDGERAPASSAPRVVYM